MFVRFSRNVTSAVLKTLGAIGQTVESAVQAPKPQTTIYFNNPDHKLYAITDDGDSPYSEKLDNALTAVINNNNLGMVEAAIFGSTRLLLATISEYNSKMGSNNPTNKIELYGAKETSLNDTNMAAFASLLTETVKNMTDADNAKIEEMSASTLKAFLIGGGVCLGVALFCILSCCCLKRQFDRRYGDFARRQHDQQYGFLARAYAVNRADANSDEQASDSQYQTMQSRV